jgi:hypothetical protein
MIVSFALERLNTASLLAFFDSCKVSDDSLNCRLADALSLLHVVGAVLAVILLAVVIFAVHAWKVGKTSGEFPQDRHRTDRSKTGRQL